MTETQITTQELLLIIGEQQVEIRVLRAQLQQATKEVADGPRERDDAR